VRRRQHAFRRADIFVARGNYRQSKDTKSGKRRDTTALLSFHKACALGFRDNLDEWSRRSGCIEAVIWTRRMLETYGIDNCPGPIPRADGELPGI